MMEQRYCQEPNKAKVDNINNQFLKIRLETNAIIESLVIYN